MRKLCHAFRGLSSFITQNKSWFWNKLLQYEVHKLCRSLLEKIPHFILQLQKALGGCRNLPCLRTKQVCEYVAFLWLLWQEDLSWISWSFHFDSQICWLFSTKHVSLEPYTFAFVERQMFPVMLKFSVLSEYWKEKSNER